MKLVIILVTLIISFTSTAQTPHLISLSGYGGSNNDVFNNFVTPTSDGGFITCMTSYSPMATGNIDSFCVLNNFRNIFTKYNADATVKEWTKCFEYQLTSAEDTELLYLFPQNDGGNVLAGIYDMYLGLFVSKQDISGNIVWSHSYSKDNNVNMNSMIQTPDGGYIIVGTAYANDTNFTVHSTGGGMNDIAVIKLDSLGRKQFSKAYGGTNDDVGLAICNAQDGGFYILATTNSNDFDCTGNHGGHDAWLGKIDLSGNLLWHKCYGGTGEDKGMCLSLDGRAGFLIGGETNSVDGDISHPIADGRNSMWLSDVDSNGNINWNNCYGGGDDIMYSMCRSTDGSIWMGGYNRLLDSFEVDSFFGGSIDAWIVHADSNGDYLGSKVLGSSQGELIELIYPLIDGNVFCGGYYSANNNTFLSLNYFGMFDAFEAILAPATTGIQSIKIVEQPIMVNPNPAESDILVTFPTTSGSFSIWNSVGQCVYNDENSDNKLTISLSTFPSGLYLIRWLSTDNQSVSCKFIKQ